MKNWNDSAKKIRVSPKFAVRGQMASSERYDLKSEPNSNGTCLVSRAEAPVNRKWVNSGFPVRPGDEDVDIPPLRPFLAGSNATIVSTA